MITKYNWPAPSTASRKPSARSRGSSRGVLIDYRSNRQIVFESRLEMNTAYYLMGRADVVDIRDQPPAVSYIDQGGMTRHHTFDFRVVLESGRRIAIACKPFQIAQKTNFQGVLDRIERHLDPDFAQDIVLFTEKTIHPAELELAKRLHFSRRSKDKDADRIVTSVAPDVPTRILDLMKITGLGAPRTWQSIMRLIDARILSAVRPLHTVSLETRVVRR